MSKFNKHFELNGKDHAIRGEVSCSFKFHPLDGWTVEDFQMTEVTVWEEGVINPITHLSNEKDAKVWFKEHQKASEFEEIISDLIEDLFEEAQERYEARKLEHHHNEEAV